jgi:hypothetical protein
MLPLSRTPIWTLARRRRFIETFRRDLESYFAAVSYEAFAFRVVEDEAAAALRRGLEERIPTCRRTLAAAESVPMVRHVSGERPGAVIQVNLLEAAFQLDRFDLTRDDLFGLLDAAGVVHARESRAAWIRTVNPFYWLDMTLAVLEVVPFLPLRLVGKDP